MPKESNEQPDKKKVDSVSKKLKAVCDDLKTGEQELKNLAKIAKEIDKASK
jgi:hypothetical protein